MANNFDAFIRKMEQAPRYILDAQTDAVSRSALVVTTAVRAEISRVAPGGVMMGVGRSGAKVGAGFTLKAGAHPTAIVSARGPLHLLERDTKAHQIGVARKRGRRAGQGNPVLKIGDKFRRGPISHPGTKGKYPFEKGVNKGEKFVPEVMRRSVRSSLAKVFTG